jgi:hypothetical protein
VSCSRFTFIAPHVSRICNSRQVFLGTWNNTPVALKVLATEAGSTPSSMVCCSLHIGVDILTSLIQAIRQEIEVRIVDIWNITSK